MIEIHENGKITGLKPIKKILSRGIIISLAIFVSIGLIFFLQQSLKESNVKVDSQLAGPTIGGSFSLLNQDGKPVTTEDFHGKYMLVFFGYTFCPDVCPTALTNITDALGILGRQAEKITPVFITVDPVRDTVPQIKEYVKFFHPNLVALTGTEAEIRAVTKAYRVYFAKSKENNNEPEDYLMDHSAVTYLMGTDGKFLAHFSHGLTPKVLAQRIGKNL